MQYVKIDLSGRAYTYAWAGDQPLAVGDWVVVPGNSYNPDPSTGRVLRLLPKCDFTGKVTILRQRIDVRKPQQVDSLTERVSRAVGPAIPKKQHVEYGYEPRPISQEEVDNDVGPAVEYSNPDNYMDTQYRGDMF